ncbi:hypothetical protein CKAH01_11882 [Colletotrichum kahawae]|uniref:Uncharacterized protein n=1 Tax=Colletotrichum kahawae TaxID=34407 RepID=A0AAD9YS52_COLKA|nr:hypothetical protein CKAH01_11882 [Colletotrichum kahawae]
MAASNPPVRHRIQTYFLPSKALVQGSELSPSSSSGPNLNLEASSNTSIPYTSASAHI